MITKAEIAALWLEACPSFRPAFSATCAGGNEEALYIHAGVFADHLLTLHRSRRHDEFTTVATFIERLHNDGDPYTREFATVGILEGIQNVWSHTNVSPEEFFPFLLPSSAAAWHSLNQLPNPMCALALRTSPMSIPASTWLIYVFSIEGSYIQNIQRAATVTSDTQQYWITDTEAWDVRTFAIDKDVRIQTHEYRGHVDDPVKFFDSLTQDVYGDIIAAQYRIDIPAGATAATLREQISQLGLHPNVKWTALDFPLWLPEDTKYFSHDDE